MANEKRYPGQTAVIHQLLPRDRYNGPDTLLEDLHKPLPDELVLKIIDLKRKKKPRNQIARELGISKLRVNHELMRLGGKK